MANHLGQKLLLDSFSKQEQPSGLNISANQKSAHPEKLLLTKKWLKISSLINGLVCFLKFCLLHCNFDFFLFFYFFPHPPATKPVVQAICKLYPPVGPSKSKISPAKYKLSTNRERIVLESTSLKSTPPLVIIA